MHRSHAVTESSSPTAGKTAYFEGRPSDQYNESGMHFSLVSSDVDETHRRSGRYKA
jgi:hypothetical protein